MAIAGATTNNRVIKCLKWNNINKESKNIINLNPKVVCIWLSDRLSDWIQNKSHLYSILEMLQKH